MRAPLVACLLLALQPLASVAQVENTASAVLEELDGRGLMDAVYERHRQYPFVYEEQSMVLVDRNGRKETRQLRRYSRVEDDGTFRILLHFRFPREVQGVALLASRAPDGTTQRHVFLPALGPFMIGDGEPGTVTRTAQHNHFLGTDFSVEDLTGEVLDDYRYVRREDAEIEGSVHHIVDVYPAGDVSYDAWPRRRHFIRSEELYITRTDHLDQLGRLTRRQTHHDLVRVIGETWRANTILMENHLDAHRSIVMIDERVFSPDYVPTDVFSPAWIFANAPPPETPRDDEPPTLSEIAAGLGEEPGS